MAIHEKSLIRPENITSRENLVIDGIDVSGDWSTFIHSRVVTDYNEQLEEEIASLPAGNISTAVGSAALAQMRVRSMLKIQISIRATGFILSAWAWRASFYAIRILSGSAYRVINAHLSVRAMLSPKR